MSERKVELSEWWTAEHPERRVWGELRFDQSEGARLILLDELQDVRVHGQLPTLHGEAFGGTRYTLMDAVVTEARRETKPPEGIARSRTELRATGLLEGVHTNLDMFEVRVASVRLTGVRDLCKGGFLRHIFEGIPRAQRFVQLKGGVLNFHALSTSGDDAVVQVECQEPLTLQDFEERWLIPLRSLIVFAARGPVLEQELIVHPEHGNDVHVLTEAPSLTATPPATYDRPLVPFVALGDGAEEFISAWFEMYAKLDRATDFLISALDSELFLENRLLNLTSFLESYHRTLHDQPPVSSEDHERNMEAMLEALPDQSQREHYAEKLRHADQQNARQRFREMVVRARDTLGGLDSLGTELVDQLMQARNANTHLDPTGPQGPEGVDLIYAVANLRLVIQTNMLLDLKLDPELVAGLVLTSYGNQMPVFDFREHE
jgi:hypothetical protein